jgi:hypothetical protein
MIPSFWMGRSNIAKKKKISPSKFIDLTPTSRHTKLDKMPRKCEALNSNPSVGWVERERWIKCV